jgi:hypothetical protein
MKSTSGIRSTSFVGQTVASATNLTVSTLAVTNLDEVRAPAVLYYDPATSKISYAAPDITPQQVAAGSEGDVQFNRNGLFSAQGGLNFTRTTNTLTVSGPLVCSTLLATSLFQATTPSILFYSPSTGAVTYGGVPVTVVPGGSSGQIQFNGSGTFSGSSNLRFDSGTGNLTVGRGVLATLFQARGGESTLSDQSQWSDPDPNVQRSLKVSGSGMAVSGGVKADTFSATGSASAGTFRFNNGYGSSVTVIRGGPDFWHWSRGHSSDAVDLPSGLCYRRD